MRPLVILGHAVLRGIGANTLTLAARIVNRECEVIDGSTQMDQTGYTSAPFAWHIYPHV